MAGTVSFKVYMSAEDDPSKKEVRRFGIEADVVTNFVYLREKMQTIFPSLRGKHFTVSWKDSDGDDVTISSNEELQIALEETSLAAIRKLHVFLHSEYPTQRNPSESQPNVTGPIHVGVSCDGCDKQIQGFRYKCIQCPDYDLCVDCESRGMHPEHCMIRLSIPLQWKPHYGKRLATQVNRFVRKAQSSTCKDEELKSHCPFKNGKHHGKSRHSTDAQSWIDTFATYLDEWANLPGECPMANLAKECPMKETAKEAKEQSASSSSETKNGRENEKSPAEQIRLLTNVGLAVGENFLSQFFDPLVNMQAKNDKPTSSTSGTSSGSASPPAEKATENNSQATEKNVPTPKFPGEGKKLRETKNDETGASAQSPSGDQPMNDKVFVDNEGLGLGWTLLNKSDSPTPSVKSVVSTESTGAVPKQVPSAPAEASSKPIYPSLVMEAKPMEEKPVYHPNPTIQKSVESMIQMGFSNEGGWLTNLLISKGGDIAAALDALSPVRR